MAVSRLVLDFSADAIQPRILPANISQKGTAPANVHTGRDSSLNFIRIFVPGKFIHPGIVISVSAHRTTPSLHRNPAAIVTVLTPFDSGGIYGFRGFRGRKQLEERGLFTSHPLNPN